MKRASSPPPPSPTALKKQKPLSPATSTSTPNTNAEEETTTFFGRTLAQTGFVLTGAPTATHSLTEDGHKVRTTLKNRLYFDERVRDAFVDGFLEHVDEGGIEALRKALRPASRDGFSLVRICLGVEPIQARMAQALLEMIPEYSDDDPKIGKQILGAFRWLDTLVDGEGMAAKLLELLDVVDVDLQRELISFLPEIVDDSAHATVVKALQDLMEEKPYLSMSVLDTLANLHLEGDVLTIVRSGVLDKLGSAPVDETPVLIKFLLQTISGPDASSVLPVVLREIRANLDFVDAPNPGSRSGEGVALEALKAGVMFRPDIARAFLKEVGNPNREPHMHKGIDLWILVVVGSLDARKKAVKTLLRKKINSGAFTKPLLARALVNHAEALKEYVPVMRSLAEELLRSPSPIVSSFAGAWYRHLFTEFTSPLSRQDVLATIVTHVGSANASEVSSALHVLIDLASDPRSATAMRSFTPFLKGMLDYLFTQPNTQVRLLFKLFMVLAVGFPDPSVVAQAKETKPMATSSSSTTSTTSTTTSSTSTSSPGSSAFCTSPQESSLRDELSIIIRKHVSNPNLKFKRIGILGGVAAVAALAPFAFLEPGPDKLDESTLREEMYTGVRSDMVEWLNMIRDHTRKARAAFAFFADEVASLILAPEGKLPTDMVFYISTELSGSVFESLFVVDNNTELLPEPALGIQPGFVMDLDFRDGSPADVAISMIGHLMAGDPADREQILGLAPEFRLMHVCEKFLQSGSMDEIEAILGCPLALFDSSATTGAFHDLSVAGRDLVIHGLFHAINWFRELINAFSNEASTTTQSTKSKVVTRLANMLHLANLLIPLLDEHACVLPVVGRMLELDDESSGSSSSSRGGARASSAKGKGKGKKPKRSASSAGAGADVLPILWRADSGLESIKNSLRELDLDVFSVLQFPKFIVFPLTEDDKDRAAGFGATLESQPHLLHALLVDLGGKIKKVLPSRSASLVAAFGGSGGSDPDAHAYANLSSMDATDVFDRMVRLVPALCEHLERLNSFLASECGTGRDDAMAAHLMVRILSIFRGLLSYAELAEEGMRGRAGQLLEAIGQRMRMQVVSEFTLEDTESVGDMGDLATSAFDYFSKVATEPASHDLCAPVIAVLEAIQDLVPGASLGPRISGIAHGFLTRNWGGAVSLKSKLISKLLDAYIGKSGTPVTAIDQMVSVHITALVTTEAPPPGMPSLTKTTFPTFFRSVLEALVEHLRESEGEDEDLVQRMARVTKLVQTFSALAKTTKTFTARAFLVPILKAGIPFSNLMAKHIVAFSPHFRTYHSEIMLFLKPMQVSTRILQAICAESKILDSKKMGKFVPQVRKGLETLIFRIKAMLSSNEMQAAFWIGNLKHRSITGEIVSDRIVDDGEDDSSDDDDQSGDEMGGEEGEGEEGEGGEDGEEGEEGEDGEEEEEDEEDEGEESETF